MTESPQSLSLDDQIAQAVAARHAANDDIWALVRKVKQDKSLTPKARQQILTELYSPLSDKDVQQFFAGDASNYQIGMSFRGSLVHLRRMKWNLLKRGVGIAPGNNSKAKDRRFGASLGIPTPTTYADNVPFADIELLPKSMLKPVRGVASQGAFLVDEKLQLHSIRTGKIYADLAAAKKDLAPIRHVISADAWTVEQIILGPDGEPANDVKVLMFYGQHGLVIETDRSRTTVATGVTRQCSYNVDGKPFDRGNVYTKFVGEGVPDGVIELAQRVSLATPMPFLRVDFHKGADGCYLGEITPQPGAIYAGLLHEHVDRELGRYFSEAEARLYLDLLKGKSFEHYFRTYEVELPL